MSPFRGWIIHWNMAVWIYEHATSRTVTSTGQCLFHATLPQKSHDSSEHRAALRLPPLSHGNWLCSLFSPAQAKVCQAPRRFLGPSHGKFRHVGGSEMVISACLTQNNNSWRSLQLIWNKYLSSKETCSLNLRWVTKPTTLQICSHTFKTILNALLMRVSVGTLHILLQK
jgi:hypothetical protein